MSWTERSLYGLNIFAQRERMMEHHDLQDSHHAWLEDIEYRQEFGSESAKLEIAVALAAARKTAGVTQARLAELAEVSQAYIAKLESGEANPP